MKFRLQIFVVGSLLLLYIHGFNINSKLQKLNKQTQLWAKNEIHKVFGATLGAFGLAQTSFAAEQPPATVGTPIPIATSVRSSQSSTFQKWSYSKLLEEVEKDGVEKLTFSPEGKKAVGVDSDGDRFAVDIPNDPNLLSFLVQHKVEINVAPLNSGNGAFGSTSGADGNSVTVPTNEVEKFVQTFGIPFIVTGALYVAPGLKALLPSKEDLEAAKKPSKAKSSKSGGLFGGGGPGRIGPRGPGGLDPESFAK